MALTPGTRLGPYEVTAQIGKGGMGEVYRATDTNLKRSVAIKVLPASVAGDAERLARFQREAEVLAALNHPNIAAIYGLERSGATTALVMELVEGPTLADSIAGSGLLAMGSGQSSEISQGPGPRAQSRRGLPIDEALPVAKQIAEALEAAHEQGIIHRDLKPANIKVRPDGTVKVLDFGLAKAMESPNAMSPSVSQAPTITTPAMMTGVGMILGTAAYMSPEQARGKPVDKRADIWAFGAVLFEMLTGRRAFEGDDISDTLANVLKVEPAWDALPAGLPATLVVYLKRCLHKDWKQRLGDMHDMRLALEGAFDTGTPARPEPAGLRLRSRWVISMLVAAVTGMAITGGCLAVWSPVPASLDTPTVRVSVQPSQVFENPGVSEIALSPNGRYLAFTDRGPTGKALWTYALDTGDLRQLSGTDGASHPFWSPDSRFIGFYSVVPGSALKRVPVSGGPVQTIGETGSPGGATWNQDGTIVFGTYRGALFQVQAAGGIPVALTNLDESGREISHLFPQFLPDGSHLIYFVSAERPERRGVYVRSLGSSDATRVLATDSPGVFVHPGHILTVRDQVLLAYPFSTDTLEVDGEPVAVADGAGRGSFSLYPAISASANGVLAYGSASGIGSTQLAWVDRTGRRLGSIGTPESIVQVRLSPDQSRVVVLKRNPTTNMNDVWITELSTQVSAPFASDAGDPIWSPDGTRIAFYARRGGQDTALYEKPVGGGDERLLLGSPANTEDWTNDGQSVIIRQRRAVLQLPLSGTGPPVQLLPETPYERNQFYLSPGGNWIAYTSRESGTVEVWVASFPGFAHRRQVSSGGGYVPRWRNDQRELYYLTLDGDMMAVTVKTGTTIETGQPSVLFKTRILSSGGFDRYDVTGDGQRFLLLEPPESASAPPITLVTNWTTLLQR